MARQDLLGLFKDEPPGLAKLQEHAKALRPTQVLAAGGLDIGGASSSPSQDGDSGRQDDEGGVRTGAQAALPAGLRLPSVQFKVSGPNMLDPTARTGLAVGLLALALLGVVGELFVLDSTGTATVVTVGVISLTAAALSYFTVMGFSNVDYGAGIEGSAAADSDSDTDSASAGTPGAGGTPRADDALVPGGSRRDGGPAIG